MHGRQDASAAVRSDARSPQDIPLSTAHAARHFLMSASLLVLLGALITIWPASLGGRTTIVFVSGQSMIPTLTENDVVIAREYERYAVGDLVVFRVPDGEARGRYIIHRIVGGSSATGWVTRGDNRTTVDPWFLSNGDVVGRAERKAAIGPELKWFFRWMLAPVVWAIGASIVVYVVALRYLREREMARARDSQSSRNSTDSTA